jgi:hypothetical protein
MRKLYYENAHTVEPLLVFDHLIDAEHDDRVEESAVRTAPKSPNYWISVVICRRIIESIFYGDSKA